MFELKEGKVIISPDKLNLPYFQAIWQEDKSKTKEVAFMELGYIFYLCDAKSPYNSYPEDKRKELILADIIKNKKWKPSKLVEEAIVKYKELTITPSSMLLESIKGLLYRMVGFYDSITFDPKSKDIELEIRKMEAAQKATANVGKSLESLVALEERVKKESMSFNNKRRGTAENSMFEDNEL